MWHLIAFAIMVLGVGWRHHNITGTSARTLPQASDCVILRAVDGDTLRLQCGGRADVSARLLGFDAPKSFRPRCDCEGCAGRADKRALMRYIGAARDMLYTITGHGKYGRLLMRAYIDGRDLAVIMIVQRHAVRYSGGRRINCCERLAR